LFFKGHPIIYKFSQTQSDHFDIKKYFGLVTCIVLPPNILHLPILPTRYNDKLFFTLCYMCMTNNNTNYCNHTDSERSFFGTWGVPELELALKHGYKILRFSIKIILNLTKFLNLIF